LTNTKVTATDYNGDPEKNYSILKINNPKNNTSEFRFNQCSGGDYLKCDHTNSLVPLYVKGEGSQYFLKRLNKYKSNQLNFDKLSGTQYLDNTDIAKMIMDMIKEK
jgi:hypothetical protein